MTTTHDGKRKFTHETQQARVRTKIEFRVGGIQTRTPIGSGEFVEFRIVRFRDVKRNVEKEAWVKLEFEAFRLRSVVWKPHPTGTDD